MTTSVRPKIVGWARWGVEHKAGFDYEEIRPMPLTSRLPLTTDCSGFVTLCYFLAGAPDPNGLGYDGEGYTGTLLGHGQEIDLAHVLPGDAIVYGPGTGWHTAVIVEPGDDPLTVSMGEQGDPSYVRVSQDGRQPQRYLRFATNSRFPAPTPVHRQPAPHGRPTPAQLAHTGLVALAKPSQAAAARRNGWNLWYFASERFEPVVGSLPPGTALYASRTWRTHR